MLPGLSWPRASGSLTALMAEGILSIFDERDAPDAAARVRDTLAQDPLGLMRAAAHIASTGQLPLPVFTRAAADQLGSIERASAAELRPWLEDVIMGKQVHLGLQWLHEATVGMAQEAGRKHKDVWEHTKQVVRQSVPRPDVRWGALLHDIGKVPTRTFTKDGGVHFHGHAEVGARMFEPIARRLGFIGPQKKVVKFLIYNHLRASHYSAGWTDSAVRRFDREMGEHLKDLLDLSRADITSKRPGRRQELLRQIHELEERILTLRELDAKQPPLPKGLGNALMEKYGIPPSKRIGDIKRALEEACERGELEERREDEYYLDWIEKTGLLERVK
jgi:poly(A) polymerase